MGTFQDGLMALENLGVLDVIIPFILVFTIVFAVLQKTKILGEENNKPRKNFNAVISLVMALAVIIPHVMGTYPDGADVVTIMNNALPNVSAVMISVLMLLLIIGVFGTNIEFAGTSMAGIAVLFAITATVIIFGSAASWFALPDWLGFLQDSDTQALVIVILVFALIIWFVTKEDKPKDPEDKSMAELLGDVLKPKK